MTPSKISRLQRGLAQLQACSSTTEVWRLAAHDACTELGFARTLALRLQGTMLFVDGVHNVDHTIVGAQIGRAFAITESPPIEELTQRGVAMLLPSAASPVRGALPWPEAAPSRGFVAAPIPVGRQIIGVMCADHHGTGYAVNGGDRDWLGTYAGAVGLALHRVELEERLRHVSRQARALLSISATAREPATAHPSSFVRREQQAASSTGHGALARLTPREHDVLRLMAVGRSNVQIGNELLITRETVKSHVARLHRKLGVVNRTEAVALYERANAAAVVEVVL